jgi:precorrin-6A/cobalt-precorrin-6A reductase
MRVLVLGGTGEARALADALTDAGHAVTSSLAGRTRDPLLPKGEVRVGGFGGVPGLVLYLRAQGFDYLVDATHPYAGQMSTHAVAAAEATGTPLLRLMRPAWREPEAAPWIHVRDIEEAAHALPADAHVLVTSGHAGLATLMHRSDCCFLVRLIEPPAEALPAYANLLIDRPPYTIDEEAALLEREAITHLISKNSGGAQTAAKLEAARQRNVRVVMIDRPDVPPAPEVASVAEAIAALHEAGPRR